MKRIQDTSRDILDLFQTALEKPDTRLSPADQKRLERLKNVYTHWLDHPLLTDTMIRDYMMTNFGVGRAMAYNDIALIKAAFGHVSRADKEFQRVRANRLLEMAAAAAIAGDERKAKCLTKIAEAIVKANQLDEPEGDMMPWDEIVPRDESFSVDPEVIGIKKVPDIENKARKLLKKWTQEIDGNDVDEQ